MVLQLSGKIVIENLRNYPAETIQKLRDRLTAGGEARPEPRRQGFYDVEMFDLTAARWRMAVEFGKLLFEVWNPSRSIARRVEEIAYRDRGRLGLFVRKPGGRETSTLELRSLESPERAERAEGRARFRKQLLDILTRQFSGSRFERVSNRSDREHSFSTWYTRGWARQGRTAWAFLGLSEHE